MSKPSSNYRLSKSIIEQTPISYSKNIQNTQTNEVWRAKVFQLQKIQQYDMMNVLQYNEQVFHFLKDNYENSLYLESCFQKDNTEYMVFQFWTERLSDYICKNPNGLKDKEEVQNILQTILMLICDIYAEDFMILNLRPDHLVRVANLEDNSLSMWKIQSLVYDYINHGLPEKCEYQFDFQWASNEEKAQRQNLQDKFKDQQIVWYMGILTLRLVYGTTFKLNKQFKDSDIDLIDLKQRCLPQVFELIQKSVKANLKDRIPLKSFLNLDVFKKIQISSDVKEKFIFGNSQRIKKSQIMKNSISQKSSLRQSSMSLSITTKLPEKSRMQPPKLKASLKSTSLTQTQATKLFQQLRWMLQKCFYLSEIKNYTQSAASIDSTSVEDKTVIRYFYFKLAEINLTKITEALKKSLALKSFRESVVAKQLYKQLLKCIQQNENSSQKKSIKLESLEYEKKMRILDPKKLVLLSDCQQIVVRLKKSIENARVSPEELADGFSMINGKFFSSIKKYVQRTEPINIQNRGIKIRALCYFILSSYVLLIKPKSESPNILNFLIDKDFQIYQKQFFNEQRLSGSVHVKFADEVQYIHLCEFTSRAKEQALIQNSRHILNSYFKTIHVDDQKDFGKGKDKNQMMRRVSLTVF